MLSGISIARRGIARDLLSTAQQVQPCGVDVSLRRVLQWTSPAAIHFDNARRRSANTSEIPFTGEEDTVKLPQAAYLVEFNETVDIPLDCMGQLFVRSSLWRAGALVSAGVIDAGYKGALGAVLDVRNPKGLILGRNARIAQITVHKLDEKVDGYRGIYQSSASTVGRDGEASSGENEKSWTFIGEGGRPATS